MTADQDALLDQLEDIALALNLKAMSPEQLNDLARICSGLSKHVETELSLRG